MLLVAVGGKGPRVDAQRNGSVVDAQDDVFNLSDIDVAIGWGLIAAGKFEYPLTGANGPAEELKIGVCWIGVDAGGDLVRFAFWQLVVLDDVVVFVIADGLT